MPSSKAMENKTLAARCANPECGKQQSTELLVAVRVGPPAHRRLITLCAACDAKGWRPAESGAQES